MNLRPMPSPSDDEAWDKEALILLLHAPLRFKIYAGRTRKLDGRTLPRSGMTGIKGLYELALVENADAFAGESLVEQCGKALVRACVRVAEDMDIEVVQLKTNMHPNNGVPIRVEDK